MNKLSNILIRTANLNDLDAISEVEAKCFPAAEAATKEEFRDRLSCYKDHFWLMFTDYDEYESDIDENTPSANQQLVAFVDGMVTDEPDLTDEMYENASMHNESGSWQMIFGVNTLPEYRKNGCAGQLIERAIEDAKKQGRRGLVLTCKDKLIHYYSKFGFVNEGVSSSVHGNVTWYQMRLTF